MQIVAIAVSLVSLVCWILVLVKIFQSGQILWGVLGICAIVSFIYGWVKVNELGIRNIMIIWTIAFIASIVLNVAMGPMVVQDRG